MGTPGATAAQPQGPLVSQPPSAAWGSTWGLGPRGQAILCLSVCPHATSCPRFAAEESSKKL